MTYLTHNDKIIFKKLINHKAHIRNGRRFKRDSVLYIIEKYNRYMSPAFLKFLKIRCLLNNHYIIYNRYVQSLHYRDILKEVENEASLYRRCLNCGKPILLHEKDCKHSLDFIFSKKKTCSKSCLGIIGSTSYHKSKTETIEKRRLQKIRSTMIKRYGAPTTLQSPILKKKVQQTNYEKYGYKCPTKNKAVSQKISNTLRSKTCLKK